MASVYPRYQEGPVTYTAAEAITGGQLVEARASSVVGVAGAASVKVLGVALKDASNAAQSATDATSPSNSVAVAHQCEIKVTYAANANFGDLLKAAAAGQVTPLVVGTDDMSKCVGRCKEVAGVTSGNTGLTWIN